MYFPWYIPIAGKPVLVYGSDEKACAIVEQLLQYGCDITVCADCMTEAVKALPVSLQLTSHPARFMDGKLFVICASDDAALNKMTADDAMARNIPVCNYTDPEHSTFLYPATAIKGPLSVSCTTGLGENIDVWILDKMISDLPKDMECILTSLQAAWNQVQTVVSDYDAQTVMDALFQKSLEQGPLSQAEVEAFLNTLPDSEINQNTD